VERSRSFALALLPECQNGRDSAGEFQRGQPGMSFKARVVGVKPSTQHHGPHRGMWWLAGQVSRLRAASPTPRPSSWPVLRRASVTTRRSPSAIPAEWPGRCIRDAGRPPIVKLEQAGSHGVRLRWCQLQTDVLVAIDLCCRAAFAVPGPVAAECVVRWVPLAVRFEIRPSSGRFAPRARVPPQGGRRGLPLSRVLRR